MAAIPAQWADADGVQVRMSGTLHLRFSPGGTCYYERGLAAAAAAAAAAEGRITSRSCVGVWDGVSLGGGECTVERLRQRTGAGLTAAGLVELSSSGCALPLEHAAPGHSVPHLTLAPALAPALAPTLALALALALALTRSASI